MNTNFFRSSFGMRVFNTNHVCNLISYRSFHSTLIKFADNKNTIVEGINADNLNDDSLFNKLKSGLDTIQNSSIQSTSTNLYGETMINLKSETLWDNLIQIHTKTEFTNNTEVNKTVRSILNTKWSDLDTKEFNFNSIIDYLKTHNVRLFKIENSNLIINLDEANKVISKTVEALTENNLNFSIDNLILGFSAGMLYRKIVLTTTYAILKIKDKKNESKLSESNKVKYLKDNKKLLFSKKEGLLITISLLSFIYLIKSNNSMKVLIFNDYNIISLPAPSFFEGGGGTNDNKKLLFPILSIFKSKYKKLSKIIFILIILIISYIIPFHASCPQLIFIYFKYILVFILFLFFLLVFYYLYLVLILVKKFVYKNIEINIPKYLPSKIKNHILYLINLNEKEIIVYLDLYVIDSFYTFLLLFLFTFITLFYIF